jgi:xanthosine utilization system XapX-like protein
MSDVLLMLGVVFAVNLVPAFAPPTWTVLVFFLLRYDIPEPVLVVGGAAAAACGRFVLASLSRRFGRLLPERKRADLAAVGERLEQPRSRLALFAVFVFSPLPSAQLFIAAGLTPNLSLPPLTAAFFAGRLASYSLYVGGASVAQRSLEGLLDEGISSPWAIALQLGMLALLVAFVLVPWARILGVDRDLDARAGREVG